MAFEPPEIIEVTRRHICCDASDHSHPRVWLHIPYERNWVECPYCDARYVLKEGAAEEAH